MRHKLPQRCGSQVQFFLRPFARQAHLISMPGFADIQLTDTVSAGVLAGDRDALASAYGELARAVMNMSTRMLNDRQLAEEVVQDTFIDLVEKAAQIQDQQAVVPWVRKVAVNHCLMRLRSPWHARRMEMDSADLEARPGEEEDLDWMAQIPSMERALGMLSDDARTVVWLHDVEGYTHKEIGELMGKTASFSKSQLARAYEKLLAWRAERQRLEAAAQPTAAKTIKEGQDAKKTLGNIGSPCSGGR